MLSCAGRMRAHTYHLLVTAGLWLAAAILLSCDWRAPPPGASPVPSEPSGACAGSREVRFDPGKGDIEGAPPKSGTASVWSA